MEWLTYLLKVSACMALFYAFYHFCLQRLTFFSINRLYLLATLLTSFAIPALQFEVERTQGASPQELASQNQALVDEVTVLAIPPQSASAELTPVSPQSVSYDWEQVLYTGYAIVSITILMILIVQILLLLRHTRKVNTTFGRLKVVYKPTGFTNCSFLNYVFVDQENLTAYEIDILLQHESVHASKFHSADKLLITIGKIILWFNPFIYLYEKALDQVHEYQADKEASSGIGNASYARILLNMSVRKNNLPFVHNFVKNPLKERIKMLFTSKSKNMKKLTYLAVLPIGLALTWAFTVQVVYANKPPEEIVKTNKVPIKEETPLNPRETYDEREAAKIIADKPIVDTLRMIDDPRLGENPEVIIDGKTYNADILTKISPRCVQTKKIYIGKVEITTINSEIEYANKIDRENVLTSNKANALNKFYVRYTLKNQDGSRYDVVKVRHTGGSISVSLSKNDEILLFIDGKQYFEKQVKTLTAEQFSELTASRATSVISPALRAKYGNKYKAFIEISKPGNFSEEEKRPLRDADNIEADDKVSYSAKDSIIVSEKEAFLELFGEVNITKGQLSITADKAKYEHAGQIVYAKGVSFTNKHHHTPITASFVKFNLKEGTYQILQDIPDL